MRILLIKPYQPTIIVCTQPPLGILYLVSSIRERFGKAAEISILDMKSRGLGAVLFPSASRETVRVISEKWPPRSHRKSKKDTESIV